MDDFHLHIAHILDGKLHGSFNAVQVVVNAKPCLHEKRRCHAGQIQFGGKSELKKIFDKNNCFFGFFHVQNRFVILWNKKIGHLEFLRLVKICANYTKSVFL